MKYIRQRYILFEILSKDKKPINGRDFLNLIWYMVKKIFGIKATYQVGLWLVRWDPKKKIGIIRLDNVSKYNIIAALSFITHIHKRTITVHTRKTTGTVKKALKISEKYFNCIPPKL